MHAEILTIGDELTRGEIVDTNSSWFAARLWELDVTVRWMTSCRDDEADVTRALTDAVGRADLVIVSGGLGSTEDDLTVDVVAALTGVAPAIDGPSRDRMEALWAGRGRPVTEIALRQVRVPDGARVLANPAGLAPGFEVAVRGVPVICVPGVPREVHAIFDSAIAARVRELRATHGDAPHHARRTFRLFGRGESQLSEQLRGMIDGVAGASIHYQVKYPEVLVKLVVTDRDAARAEAALDELDAALTARVGKWRYGTGDAALPAVVHDRLIARGATVAVAESCTGGLVGQLLTERAGSSRFFLGGAITYSNQEKERALGVPAAILAEHGAVSEACVRAMAEGIRERTGATLGVAVSGIAGPDGGTPEKPVGTVWLALAGAGPTRTMTFRWPGARDQVRVLAAWWALQLLREALDG